jgi:hypothetical protein
MPTGIKSFVPPVKSNAPRYKVIYTTRKVTCPTGTKSFTPQVKSRKGIQRETKENWQGEIKARGMRHV